MEEHIPDKDSGLPPAVFWSLVVAEWLGAILFAKYTGTIVLSLLGQLESAPGLYERGSSRWLYTKWSVIAVISFVTCVGSMWGMRHWRFRDLDNVPPA